MKNVLRAATVGLLIGFLSFTTPCLAVFSDTSPVSGTDTLHHSDPASSPHLLADSLIHFAKTHLGIPYRYGGTSRKGFDCSGFTYYIFSHFGYSIPHSSASQAHLGESVDRANIQKGDLIFFKGRNSRSKSVGHVGIVISEKGEPIRFIHASTNHGITIETMQSRYYSCRFLKSTRLMDVVLPLPESVTAQSIRWSEQ